MKTLYGVQLGNYLVTTKETGQKIKVNSMTKKKVGYLGEDGERYVYTKDVHGIKLSPMLLDKYQNYLEDYRDLGGKYLVLPKDTTNLYEVSYFHELQNILELHNTRIEWID